ncbi:protein kinase domain-containing protein [Streptomyces cavernae]|uniref:protein kinase domain-containing protein n=1 Tax=Streptomyces cavernae TaxID=2259034 RepID=UPI001EE3B97D|nr:protein kinase [Streptomyces cavernae]
MRGLRRGGARALVAELARAVAVIHGAGLVHRDLRPSNVVLTRDGPRIIDFGIARPEYGLTLTEPGVIPATPGYAPPEQVTGRRAGPPADVFALGAVLVFACTARDPSAPGTRRRSTTASSTRNRHSTGCPTGCSGWPGTA